MRSDDLAPFMVPPRGPDLGFRQGIVTAWDPIIKTNTIDVGGSSLTDVPLLVTSSVTIKAGDVVGLLRVRSQYFILGKIYPPTGSNDTVATVGVYGLGTGALAQWPQTTSTSEVGLIFAQVQPHGTVVGWQSLVNVPTGATARFRAYLNGAQVADSGTLSAGTQHFDGFVTWPIAPDISFEIRAQVLSGSGAAACTLIQLYEE